ncbi:MAG: hypothetical protein CVU65_06955 [Deltaproteobacteria bacterium HGW-Deltaproteobacteria-22]|nr:MAG: hypothetical protein CVU65_06955 [Deltaproteobacteria bacterium HGW-Deltaproteobacteria-22]
MERERAASQKIAETNARSNMKFFPFFLILTLLPSLISCDDGDVRANQTIVGGGTVPAGYDGPITRVLEDNIHSTKQNSSLILSEASYLYSNTFGYTRFMAHCNANGYPHDRITGGYLTADVLKNYDVLLINLVHDTRPDFTEAERQAIIDFVHGGGGLFVVADHTNVYLHAERLNRFLTEMGVTIRYESAVDEGEHSVEGKAWILINDFAQHPVTDGVSEISFLTGGTMDGAGGMAFISEQGWGDFWNPDNEEKPVGMYGNWAKDPDEDYGPLPVSQAVAYGDGRIFVIGDQNIFGNPYLYFIDNHKIAFNAMEWLAKRETEQPRLRLRRPDGFHIRIDTRADRFSMSQVFEGTDRFTFLINLSRHAEVIAHATRAPLDYLPEVFMVADPMDTVDASSLAEADAVLDAGGTVVLIQDPERTTAATVAFVQHFLPEPGLATSAGAPWTYADGYYAEALTDVRVTLPLRAQTHTYPACPALTCPGHAVLSGTAGTDTCDILCEYPAGNGRVLLMLAGAWFNQANLGSFLTSPEGVQVYHVDAEMEFTRMLVEWPGNL